MMGGKTTETCWAVNKRQENKLKNCCTRVGDLFELNVKLPCQKVIVATIPIPVAALSKIGVCGCSLDWIVGSNPVEGLDVCLL
jgi:hypothetical protein